MYDLLEKCREKLNSTFSYIISIFGGGLKKRVIYHLQQIEARILASGMMKKDYFVRSCIYNRICVVGKKETIYPLVQTVNALYLRLLEMQKAFTGADADIAVNATPNTLPSSKAIKELQIEYTNMLTAIIDLLDGAKYLWEGDCHEQQT